MESIMVKNNFTISLDKLNYKHYSELVNYLIKQRANGKSSSARTGTYDQDKAIFDFEVSSVSNLPPIYHGIKISVASDQKFEEGKVEESVHGLIKLLTELKKE